MRPAGFIIDVPITLSIAVRGAEEQAAITIARRVGEALIPMHEDIARCLAKTKMPTGVVISNVAMTSNSEDVCSVLDELPADDDHEGP